MNGYTGIFEDNEVTFEEFVWRCARAFGPLVHMRDHGFDVPIELPDVKEWSGSKYHIESLERAKKDLAKYQSLSVAAIQKEIDQEYSRMQKDAFDAIAKKKALRIKVERVYVKAKNWNPPSSDHNGLKEFMVKELEYVLEHDCDTKYYDEQLAEPKKTTAEWLKDRLEWAQRDIDYHTKHLAEDTEGINSARKWIQDLQASVQMPAYQDNY